MIDIRHARTHDASKSAEALQATLLELQALQLATKQAHWNVAGMLFWSMHEMLDVHYAGIATLTDQVAERLLAVGSPADARPRTIVERAPIAEMPDGMLDDIWILSYFTEQYAAVAERVLKRIGAIEEDDPTSANLLQEVEHAIEKDLWQMRVHLEARPGDRTTDAERGIARRVPASASTARVPAASHGTGVKS